MIMKSARKTMDQKIWICSLQVWLTCTKAVNTILTPSRVTLEDVYGVDDEGDDEFEKYKGLCSLRAERTQ